MQAADLDKDGLLTFEEFVTYVKSTNIEKLFSMDILDNLQES